ncbi:hypothetical protein HJFPF1_02645 [Paramyrothecium foliicola]|nr:hypothetical protein HJFPF1_02645 [Paramyrothecium foliicola]
MLPLDALITNSLGVCRCPTPRPATMPKIREVTALAVLLCAAVAEEHVPMHKRFSYVKEMDDFSFLGMLSKRDACSDAFGSNAHNSNCAPDFTLCCTRDFQAFPSCQQLLGKGWCCVDDGDDDKCYVDQKSACDEDSAVACTNLQAGTEQACCPKLTTCDPQTEASEGFVRCNINRGDLLVADAAQKEKDKQTESSTSSAPPSTTSTATTSEATESSTTASSSASTTESTESGGATSGADNQTEGGNRSNNGGVSGGTIAGAVVGGLGGVALVAGLVFFLLRRRKKHAYEAASQGQPTIPQFYEDQAAKYQQQSYYHQQGGSPHQGYMYSPPPTELHDRRTVAELDTTTVPQQLDSRPLDYGR